MAIATLGETNRETLIEKLWNGWGRKRWRRQAFDVYVETLTENDMNYMLAFLCG